MVVDIQTQEKAHPKDKLAVKLPSDLPELPQADMEGLANTERREAALKKLGEAATGLSNMRKDDDAESFRAALQAARELQLDTREITDNIKLTEEKSATRKSVVHFIAAAREFARVARDDSADGESKRRAGQMLVDVLSEINKNATKKGDVGIRPPNVEDMIRSIKGEHVSYWKN